MKINTRAFRVQEEKTVDLKKWPTSVKPVYKSKKDYHKLLRAQVKALSALQRLHYASNGYAVLLIFQGMDAAGKDGVIRQVMSIYKRSPRPWRSNQIRLARGPLRASKPQNKSNL